MIIRNIQAIVAMACMGAWVQGCGAAPASESDEALIPPAGDSLDESAEAIRGGIEPAGGTGAVIVGSARCTGTLIGTAMILTAAHCFANDGWVDDSITYVANGNFYRCITDPNPNNGRCTSNSRLYVRRYGTGVVTTDIAVVFPGINGEEFSNITPPDAADGIYDGSLSVGTNYTFLGQGANQNTPGGFGVMRHMEGTVSSVAPASFTATQSSVAVCGGDSGGPYMVYGSQWVFGMLSVVSSVSPGGSQCAAPGSQATAVRINPNARRWIDQMRTSYNQPSCYNTSARYPNFWFCP